MDEARKFLLINTVETYLKLDAREEAQFHGLIAQPGTEEVREMISVYEERGIKKGRQQGIEQGKREILLNSIRHKFGKIPAKVRAKINVMPTDELDALLNRILDANSLEETGLTNN